MNRISKTAKRIADAHIQARITNNFTDPQVSTREELLTKLHEGETFEQLIREIELRYCSVTSMLLSGMMNHASHSYKQAVYKAFKKLIDTAHE